MPYLLLGLMWLLNLGISIWNAYAVGKAWAEAKAAGGWPRILCWAGAVMSASGFTWCYLILVGLVAYHLGGIDEAQLTVALNLGYILLIPGILLSGLVITVDSSARAFRQGGFLNYGVAIYNTYAQIHNTYSAITSMGGAVRNVRNYFGKEGRSGSSRDSGKGGGLVVILLVVAVLALGILTTAFIISKVAATAPLPPPPSREQLEDSAERGQGQAVNPVGQGEIEGAVAQIFCRMDW